MGIHSRYAALLAVLMRLFASVSAYNFIIRNNSTKGDYYQEITDGTTGEWIGEMYQDSVFDAFGRRIGTNQGYSFDFDNRTSYNFNNILFLGDGNEIYWMDGAIISATGIYEQYQGGSLEMNVLEMDPAFVAELTLVEPPPSEENDDSSGSSTKLRITSEGGYYLPITSSNGDQIGQLFQNPITMPDSKTPNQTVGINQGFSFLFPQDDYINAVLGYSSPEQVLGNRVFMFRGNDTVANDLLVFNEQVIHATNSLEKYEGTTLSEEILSTDPNYVADISLAVLSEGDSKEEYISNGPYDFRITSKGGFYDPILDAKGEMIGERFQNPVMNSSNVRIGTNQGYGFNFPSSNFVPPIAQGNRLFYLEEGTLDVLNEVIVAASGIYSKYSGGRFQETIVSYNPVFVSEIILLEAGNNEATEDEETIGDLTSEGNCRIYRQFTLFLVAALGVVAVV
jgi:hypothetical protein